MHYNLDLTVIVNSIKRCLLPRSHFSERVLCCRVRLLRIIPLTIYPVLVSRALGLLECNCTPDGFCIIFEGAIYLCIFSQVSRR